MEALKFTIDLEASREQVWEAWTTEKGLASWLCLRARVDLVVGGAFELFWNPDERYPESNSTLGCRLLSISPPRLLSFTWRGSDDVAEVMNVDGAAPTEVTVEIRPAPHGTRLIVEHRGWGDGEGWVRARTWFERAWSDALEQLAARLKEKPE